MSITTRNIYGFSAVQIKWPTRLSRSFGKFAGSTTKAEHPPRATIPLLDLRTRRNVALEQHDGRWPHREHRNATSPSWINGGAFTLQKSNRWQPLSAPEWTHHSRQRHPTPLWHSRIYRTLWGHDPFIEAVTSRGQRPSNHGYLLGTQVEEESHSKVS